MTTPSSPSASRRLLTMTTSSADSRSSNNKRKSSSLLLGDSSEQRSVLSASRSIDGGGPVVVAAAVPGGGATAGGGGGGSPAYHHTKKQRLLFSQSLVVESLQATIEHERSMRAIDQERFRQVRTQLEQQVEFAKHQQRAEAENAEKIQARAAERTAELEKSRNDALEELRRVQMELLHGGDYRTDGDAEASLWKHKAQMYEQQLQALQQQEAQYKSEIESLQQDLQALVAKSKAQQQAKPTGASPSGEGLSGGTPPSTSVEDAEKALVQTRIRLAESERRIRQLERQHEHDKEQQKEFVRQSESLSLTSQRLEKLQSKYLSLQTQYNETVASNNSWQVFGLALEKRLRESGALPPSGGGRDGSSSSTGPTAPPEVSAVLRFLERAGSQSSNFEAQVRRHEQECARLREALQQAQERLVTSQGEADGLRLERLRLEDSYRTAQTKIATLEAQAGIAQRETTSLRELMQTFNDMPPSAFGGGGFGSVSPAGSAGQPQHTMGSPSLLVDNKTLQIRLQSLQEQLELLKKERDELSKSLEESKQSQQAQSEEIERIRAKFGLLKQALEKERIKVQEAEQRANDAQALAGKGSFDASKTQVLHFKETPLLHALREEIQVLQRQLEAARKKGAKQQDATATAAAAPDLEKLNKRLKENFKEQIALFREGVYMMTGYKVDMLPGMPADRPTFRVRSVFAENESDHLMLQWPKTDEPVESLDILNSEFAQMLSQTPSYTYMTKFHSLPAFLASVQLSLFEKQTVMM